MRLYDEALDALFKGDPRFVFLFKDLPLPWVQQAPSAYELAIAKARLGDRLPLALLLRTTEKPNYWESRQLAVYNLLPWNADQVTHGLAFRAEVLFRLYREQTGHKTVMARAKEAIIRYLCGIQSDDEADPNKLGQADRLRELIRRRRHLPVCQVLGVDFEETVCDEPP